MTDPQTYTLIGFTLAGVAVTGRLMFRWWFREKREHMRRMLEEEQVFNDMERVERKGENK